MKRSCRHGTHLAKDVLANTLSARLLADFARNAGIGLDRFGSSSAPQLRQPAAPGAAYRAVFPCPDAPAGRCSPCLS